MQKVEYKMKLTCKLPNLLLFLKGRIYYLKNCFITLIKNVQYLQFYIIYPGVIYQ